MHARPGVVISQGAASPRAEVGYRREWCEDGEAQPVSTPANRGPAPWARDRPTMVTLNLLAFVGLSQS